MSTAARTSCASPHRDCDGDGTCENLELDPRNCGSCHNDCGPFPCIFGDVPVRAARRTVAAALAAVLALVGGGCFMSSSPPDGGGAWDGALGDGASADGEIGPDVDGGMCERIGTTRHCAPLCGLPCPSGTWCNDFWDTCEFLGEDCTVDLRFGDPYNCREGRTCLTTELYRPSDSKWAGTCVGECPGAC